MGGGEGVVLTKRVVDLLSEVCETVLAQALKEDVRKGLMGCDTVLQAYCAVGLDGNTVLVVTTEVAKVECWEALKPKFVPEIQEKFGEEE